MDKEKNPKEAIKEKSIHGEMLFSILVPTIVTLVVIMLLFDTLMKITVDNDVKRELDNMANVAINMMDMENPGDYTKVGEEEVVIYKGETALNNNYDLIDKIVEGTDLNITFFYKDLRVISTVVDDNGNRLVNLAAHSKVTREVLEEGKSRFYNNVTLDGVIYYAYYKVIYNSDGQIIGMVEVLKSAKKVALYIVIRLIPVLLVGIMGIILIALVNKKMINRFVDILRRLEKQFNTVSKGKLDSQVDTSILNRPDEIGSMARSVTKMQKALKAMIELDTLTQINNRRRGDTKLSTTIFKAKNNGTQFSVAIGDIDYFKKVNDTYGHDAGDKVLVTVANILRKSMNGKGFVARWGGEEFLLVFERMDYETAVKYLKRIDEIIAKETIKINGTTIKVTMSFGITRGRTEDENNKVIKRADEMLYKAKSTGRNRVIADF